MNLLRSLLMYITSFFEDTNPGHYLRKCVLLENFKRQNFQGQFNSYIIPLRIYIFDDFKAG